MSLIENERTKLLANALDRASTACVTVGLLAPLAAVVYGATATGLSVPLFLICAASWIVGALVLHLTARTVLGGIK